MRTGILPRFLSIVGAKIATLVLSLLITPILVRLLGSSSYGDYAFVLSLLGITMILANAGIFDGTRKYIAENRDRLNWAEKVFGFYLRTSVLLASLAALVFVVFSWLGFAEQLFASDFSIYFYLLGGLIIGRQAYSVARGGLMGLGLEGRSEPLRILQKALFGVFGISLAYTGYGVAGVLAGHIISTLVVTILAFSILSDHLDVGTVLALESDGVPKKELLSFNLLSVLLILLTASLYHVDILLLRPISGSQKTGYYKAALVIAEFLWFVPNALQTILLHSTSELWSKDRTKQITSLSSKTTRYNLSLVLLLAIGLAALADDFIPLYYGEEFKASINPLLLLLPGVVGFALARPIFAIGQGKGSFRGLIFATGAAALLNLGLNLLLIPQYGVSGAATATSVSYGLMIVFHVLAARRIGFNPIEDLRLLQISVVAVLSAVVIVLIDGLLHSPLLSLLIVPPVGFIVYASLTVQFGVITPDEIEEVSSRIPPPVAKYVEYILDIFR
ncbi:lipopolysaccharide biosynthesis protein [Halobacterium noricense]|uniref:lipopolysaccharide biosynthesis protein n=1 Tax=Halobacterium noricense TaxID=223182 RepID=UPI001E5698B9|nr:polysaccharide biosynthesis C-terminal domain-containing protein [Halobacterium noricense]UHH26569.1 polysaccharide biosynthesis C-terminal domain-containing protein [Halobacterium noricense]